MSTRKLLVCSIGNPGSTYASTRHSAGHIALELFREAMGYTAFSRDRDYAGNVARSPGFDATYTLFQSPSLMNVSGKPVKAAWRAFLRELTPEEQERALLVILHDELEKPLGKIKVKKTGGVAGHNGLTSIVSSLGTKDFYRIGIGIGRPVSRDSSDVSKYVLSRFTSYEKEKLQRESLPQVVMALKQAANLP